MITKIGNMVSVSTIIGKILSMITTLGNVLSAITIIGNTIGMLTIIRNLTTACVIVVLVIVTLFLSRTEVPTTINSISQKTCSIVNCTCYRCYSVSLLVLLLLLPL